jgi:hypothetical protein
MVNSFDDWIKIGLDKGWCGPPVCYTHDSFPISSEEDDEFEEGNDPCMHMIRLYEDPEHKQSIEESHSPSMWRKPLDQGKNNEFNS